MRVTYELKAGVLTATFNVTAGFDVDEPGLPFSIGNHVTFKFPFSEGGRCACTDILCVSPE